MHKWEQVLAKVPREAPVLIAGPTASGKSDLALAIAEAQGGCIVNADALQVFSDWRILTARPDPADQMRARHALYGHVPGDQAYSVGHWLRDLDPYLTDTRPIIVGGTGLYFLALNDGLAEIPPTPTDIRALGDERLATHGIDALVQDLDGPTRARIDTQNPMRVQRAWEVLTATGRGLSEWQADTAPPRLPLGHTHAIVLAPEREWLAARIRQRFDVMLDNGLMDEVAANAAQWSPDRPSSKAIGASDLIALHRGQIDLPTATERVFLNTRQYAKRQRTWFRSRMKDWCWIDPADG